MLQYIPCISLPPAKLRRISWINGISQLSLMNRLCLGFAFKSASTLQCPNTMLFQLFTAQITAHPTAQCTCHCHWLHPALYFPLLCCPKTAWGRRRRSGGSPSAWPPELPGLPTGCPPPTTRRTVSQSKGGVINVRRFNYTTTRLQFSRDEHSARLFDNMA